MQTGTLKASTAIMAAVAAVVLTGCVVVAPDETTPDETTTRPTFTKIADETTVANSSGSIERFDDRVVLELITHELVPGNAYSVWMVILNNPSECSQSPCGDNDFGNPAVGASMLGTAGVVADESGSANLIVVRMTDDLDGTVFGPGLTSPSDAQIGIILRTHGPAIAESLEEQLSTLDGGCPPNDCADVQSLEF